MTEHKQTISVDLYPGSMGLVGLCYDLLGGDHVIPGDWPGPVGLTNVAIQDVQTIIDLANEQGVTLVAKARGEEKLDIKDLFPSNQGL